MNFEWTITIGNIVSVVAMVASVLFAAGIAWSRISRRLIGNEDGVIDKDVNIHSLYTSVQSLREEIRELRNHLQAYTNRLSVVEHRLGIRYGREYDG